MFLTIKRSTETTGLLGDAHTKNDSYRKKGWWLVFALVCGLVIVFGGFMTKWHLITQSVIKPSAARDGPNSELKSEKEKLGELVWTNNINNDDNDKKIDVYGPPGPADEPQLETEDKIDAYGPPGPPAAEKAEIPNDDNSPGVRVAENPHRNDDGEFHNDVPPVPPGATAQQLGKAFSLTILAQIAWKDMSNIVSTTFGIDNKNRNGASLAQSGSMMPIYVNKQDCIDAIDYFEKSVMYGKTGYENTYGKAGGERDCQYVDLTDFVMYNYNNNNNNNDVQTKCETELGLLSEETGVNRMFETTNRMIEYFYDNYGSYLQDCDVPDVRMIKYTSNGTRYSGLHSETHHVDGRKLFIDSKTRQVDYVGIVFLNDNFDGGDLQFIAPQAINSITPQTGSGVLFGGGLDYAHRVTPVTNGDRYVLRMIFNKKQE